MKKMIAFLLAAVLLLLPACSNPGKVESGKVHVGMSYADFKEAIDGKECFQYVGYAFYETENGMIEAAHFDGAYTEVKEVKSFDKAKTNRSTKSFESIREGMTIWEVIEKVGLPYGTETFGMISLAFKANNGDCYSIYWNTSDGWTVTSVLNMTKESSPE